MSSLFSSLDRILGDFFGLNLWNQLLDLLVFLFFGFLVNDWSNLTRWVDGHLMVDLEAVAPFANSFFHDLMGLHPNAPYIWIQLVRHRQHRLLLSIDFIQKISPLLLQFQESSKWEISSFGHCGLFRLELGRLHPRSYNLLILLLFKLAKLIEIFLLPGWALDDILLEELCVACELGKIILLIIYLFLKIHI